MIATEFATYDLVHGQILAPSRNSEKASWKIAMPTLQAAIAIADWATGLLAYCGSSILYHSFIHINVPRGTETVWLGVTVATVLVIAMASRGVYSAAAIRQRKSNLKTVGLGWLFSMSLALWLTFLTKTSGTFSRGAFTIALVAGMPAVLLVHGLLMRWLGRQFESNRLSAGSAYVILATEDHTPASVANVLRWDGVAVTGVSKVNTSDIPPTGKPYGVIGEAMAVHRETGFDAIYVYCRWDRREAIRKLFDHLKKIPVPVYLVADDKIDPIVSGPAVNIGLKHAFELQRAPLNFLQRAQKRLLDVLIASAAVIASLPFMALAAVCILIESGRPVLFLQHRRGFSGKPFNIFKFRSMTVQENGAEVRQAEKNDSRVTRIGSFLRRTSIDELPQLLNVIRGEMSLVGPRPHAIAHDDQYGQLISAYAHRHHVKPGITGWAQVNGYRGETKELSAMENRVDHDLWYINNWSIWLDLRILWRTFTLVLKDENAY
jgi:Undecaprenyl-phosphate glucose phosphotransferase